MKLFALLSLVGVLAIASTAQDRWKVADAATLRLEPSVFSQLPKNIVSFLERRGCTIPQLFGDPKPHNVIRGEFARLGQFDWAVLCSKDRSSSIIVFWNGRTRSIAEIERSEDKGFLQTIDGDGNIGFSRVIYSVDSGYILSRNREEKPDRIKHQGISDAYFEKASTVLYYTGHRWLTLLGAD